ncbi:TasA family protein [Chloroflexota bacterium]
MKKILGLTVAALMVMGLVGGGTWAYFSDPESSPNNILTAGTLDLTIGGANDPLNILTVSAAQPGASGSNSTTLANIGSATGNISIAISSITNTESSDDGTEFVNDSINGSFGELGAAAELAIYIDIDQNASFDASDVGLKYDGTTYSPSTLDYATVDSYASGSWSNIAQLATSGAAAEDDIYILWQIPYGGGVDNSYQGDSVSVNMTFTLRSP